jgi:hypothetical protein
MSNLKITTKPGAGSSFHRTHHHRGSLSVNSCLPIIKKKSYFTGKIPISDIVWERQDKITTFRNNSFDNRGLRGFMRRIFADFFNCLSYNLFHRLMIAVGMQSLLIDNSLKGKR